MNPFTIYFFFVFGFKCKFFEANRFVVKKYEKKQPERDLNRPKLKKK